MDPAPLMANDSGNVASSHPPSRDTVVTHHMIHTNRSTRCRIPLVVGKEVVVHHSRGPYTTYARPQLACKKRPACEPEDAKSHGNLCENSRRPEIPNASCSSTHFWLHEHAQSPSQVDFMACFDRFPGRGLLAAKWGFHS